VVDFRWISCFEVRHTRISFNNTMDRFHRLTVSAAAGVGYYGDTRTLAVMQIKRG
jgi:hypothetical protein